MNNRIPALDIARGAAVLLVVPFHASAELPSSAWIDLFHTVAGVRMPLLMFICGLLASRTNLVLERVVQLGWLFTLWSAILIIAAGTLKGIAPSPISIISQLIYPTTGLWFVWAVAGMTISLRLIKRNWLPTLAAFAGLSILNDAANLVGREAIGYVQTLSHAAFFYLGAFQGWRIIRWIEDRQHSILWLVPVLAGLRVLDHLTVERLGWQVFGLGERTIAICLALYLAAQINRLPVIGPKLTTIGQNTLPLYVGHFVFVYVGSHFFGHLVPTSLAVLLVTAFAFAGSMVLHRASMAFGTPWLYRVPDRIVSFVRDLSSRRNRAAQGT